MEKWKDINGYEGLYQISNNGNVYSVRRQSIMKPSNSSNGYLTVNLYKDGGLKHYRIHRLVAEAFIPNTDNKPCVDHINTVITDNRLENLRWCTYEENMNNPLSIKKWSKPIIQFDLDGNFLKKWNSAKETGLGRTSISDCCVGRRKTAGGYIWRHYDLELYLESKLFKAYGIKNKLVGKKTSILFGGFK